MIAARRSRRRRGARCCPTGGLGPALRRALVGGGAARRAALHALAALLPAVAPTVRATFDPDDALAARALGAVGDARDGPRLLAALEAHPDDLDRLVAVVDSGDAASIARARAVFRPPADPVAWMKDEAVWRRARRAAPATLEARLRRAARRAAEHPELPVRTATPAIEALVRLGADVDDLLALLRPLDPTSTDHLAAGLPRLAERAAAPPPPPPPTPLLDGFVDAERLLAWLDAGGHADAVYEVRGLHEAGLVWALAMIEDARRAPALRRLLLDLAERGHRLAVSVADTALCLLHPDEAEPIAAEVVARWPADRPLRTLDDEPPQSARLRT
ncbi:MAG: hypothetical protein H6704_20390 [Myxococcales bacterium]|nr:hypothetical protein [Myxococcales bacterium]